MAKRKTQNPTRPSQGHVFGKKVKIVGPWQLLPNGLKVATDSNGYLRDQSMRLVHRHLYEKAYGKIPAKWVVHHVDFQKQNNETCNLIALPDQFHSEIHGKMRSENTRWGRAKILHELIRFIDEIKSAREAEIAKKEFYFKHREIIDTYNAMQSRSAHLKQQQEGVENGLPHVYSVREQMERETPLPKEETSKPAPPPIKLTETQAQKYLLRVKKGVTLVGKAGQSASELVANYKRAKEASEALSRLKTAEQVKPKTVPPAKAPCPFDTDFKF